MTENLELREWIAVNLMGMPNGSVYAPSDEVSRAAFWEGAKSSIADGPKYELTWNDAALVVEAMRARGWIFSMKSYMSNSVYPWGASFAQPFSGVVQMEPGNFAPLAICLAAKAAIEATK